MRALLLALTLAVACRQHPAVPQQALQLLRTERYEQGIALVDSALKGAAPASDHFVELRLLKAELQVASRELRPALSTLDFSISPSPNQAISLCRQHLLRGHAQLLLGQQEASRESLRLAEAMAVQADSAELVAEIELRKGSLAVRAGDFPLAELSFRNALDYGVRQNQSHLRLAATGNLGFLALRSHRYEDSLVWFERTLEQARQQGARISEARALGNLGSAYYRLGDYDRALTYFVDAEKRFAAEGNRFEQQIWIGNQGNVHLSRRDYPPAVACYRQALDLARKLDNAVWTATWLSNLAQAAVETSDWADAERFNGEALTIKQKLKDPQAQAYSWNNLARIAAGRGDYITAQSLFERVMQTGEPTARLDAHTGAALAWAKSGDADRSNAAFQSALRLAEAQRSQLLKDESKLSYFSSLATLHRDYVEFLMQQGKVKQALEVAETSRARMLSERFQQRSGRGSGASIANLQRAARQQDATLISFWLAPQRSYVWVITATSVQASPLPDDKEIGKLVTSYGEVIESQRDPLAIRHPVGRRLAETLLDPIRPWLKPGGRVVLCVDGALHALNLETLPQPGQPDAYFGSLVRVAMTPSLSSLVDPTPPAKHIASSPKVLVIGNPQSHDSAFPPLEHARTEMEAVRDRLKGYLPLVLEGTAASAPGYREAQPGQFAIIHFAAHSAANRENPLESAVILSGPPQQDRLTARELLSVPLSADLVTISACRSVGARTYSGEGMVGLAWAFLRAGAHNVIASLWNVNDRSTAILMSHLYSELAKGASPTDALHVAKQQLISSSGAYRKPYYWAPFQVYATARSGGPPKTLESSPKVGPL